MPRIVDLMAFTLLAAAVPCSMLLIAYHWWRHGRLATLERLSPPWWRNCTQPVLAVTVALMVCYRSAIDRELAAWQVLAWLGYLAVYLAARLAPRRWVLAALRGLGWVVAVVCLAEVVVSGERAGLWLQNNPNKVGGLLAVLIPLTGGYPWLLVGAVALLATGSRGAAAGVMASVVASVIPEKETGFFLKNRVSQTYVFIVAVFLAIITLWGMIRPATIANRWENWKEAVGLFIERPLTGWGPGCYTRLAVYEPEHPHADSWPLTIAAEMGLVGLAAWGWLAVEVARTAARSSGRARLGLLAFVVHNLVDCTLWWPWIGIVVMVCMALLEEVFG